MSGASTKARNALTRVEADAMVRALPELPKITKPRYNRMLVNRRKANYMQAQAQTADVATFCLGERAHPSLCVMIPCRRKHPAGTGEMKSIFCDCESCLCRFLGILGCEYAFVSDNTDLIAVFRNCVVQYAKNSTCASGMKVSWAEAQC